MDKPVAKEIYANFDKEAIEAYVNYRVGELHSKLEDATGDAILKYQGAIAEVRLLLKAKDYAKRVLENA